MEDWVNRALAKWPNVPALYGWLGLDRRGRWLIKGELISRPQIIDTINRNYAADEHGRWYFQNGPQRGYVTLEYAPLLLRVDGGGQLCTHTDCVVEQLHALSLDEDGALTLVTEHGAGLLDDHDLYWALAHLRVGDAAPDEAQLEDALAQPGDTLTGLRWHGPLTAKPLPVMRIDYAALPTQLGFVRDPAANPVTDAKNA